MKLGREGKGKGDRDGRAEAKGGIRWLKTLPICYLWHHLHGHYLQATVIFVIYIVHFLAV